ARLRVAVADADAVLHFAGVSRAPDETVEQANPAIAQALLTACREAGAAPHIVYANSTHATADTPYGRGKRRAGEILSGGAGRYTNLVLPHIFGECARPHYNNVTATFIQQVIAGETPQANPGGTVHLLHAGEAAQTAINAVTEGVAGEITPGSHATPVPELLSKLRGFHALQERNIYPDLS